MAYLTLPIILGKLGKLGKLGNNLILNMHKILI